MTKHVLTSGYESFRDGIMGLVDKFSHLMLSLPAPGDPDRPVTWGQVPPEDSWWNVVWDIYWTLTGLAALWLGVTLVYALAKRDAYERRGAIRSKGRAFLLLAAGWFLLAFALHTGTTLATGFAPAAAEFFSTSGNAFKFGLGFVVAILIAAIKVVVIAAALLIILAQWVLVHFLVAAWPAFVVLRETDSGIVSSAGDIGVASLAILIGLKVVQGLFLRFLFELPLSVTDPTSVIDLLAIIVGVTLAFVAFPWYGTKKAIPSAMVTAGGRAARGSRSTRETIRERAPGRTELRERVFGGESGGSRASQRRDQARARQEWRQEKARRAHGRSSGDGSLTTRQPAGRRAARSRGLRSGSVDAPYDSSDDADEQT